ncbi:hypothetical protein CRG98_030334 [Punica granatum]|uniref:Uncharacterized protein n=1 Tax=Punica granatum TaxID=22663 RepID=A0A2I0IZ65_PUNGR|nr:hypothetical protein CRG98_030334 [Punica granatum]
MASHREEPWVLQGFMGSRGISSLDRLLRSRFCSIQVIGAKLTIFVNYLCIRCIGRVDVLCRFGGMVDSTAFVGNWELETSRESAVGVLSLFPKCLDVLRDRCVLRWLKTDPEVRSKVVSLALGAVGIGWCRPRA